MTTIYEHGPGCTLGDRGEQCDDCKRRYPKARAATPTGGETFTHCTDCEIRCWSVPGSKCACGGMRVVPA